MKSIGAADYCRWKLSSLWTVFLGSFIFLENIILCGGIGAMFVLRFGNGTFWQISKVVRLPKAAPAG